MSLKKLRDKALIAIMGLLVIPATMGIFIWGAFFGYLFGVNSIITAIAALISWAIIMNAAIRYFHDEVTKQIRRVEGKYVEHSATANSTDDDQDGDPPILN